VPVLAFLTLIVSMEKRHGLLHLSPAVAADQILRTMQGPILVTTEEGVVEVGNRAAGELLRYSEAELLHVPLGRIFTGNSEFLRNCLAGDCVADHETTWIRKDGSLVDVSLSASPLSGKGNRPVAVVLAAVDLTRHKQAERALRDREEQLRQSQKWKPSDN
jgi:PAS domain S-box-containing protein